MTTVSVFNFEGGFKGKSFIKCEDVRSISTERLTSGRGEVSPKKIAERQALLAPPIGPPMDACQRDPVNDNGGELTSAVFFSAIG